MPQVTLTVHGRHYPVACEQGQEAQVARLGRYIDQRAREMTAALGEVGESRLLLLVSLLLADELSDAYTELEALQKAGDGGADRRAKADRALGQTLDSLAERVETIAGRLEGS